jgi:hypothetical protein
MELVHILPLNDAPSDGGAGAAGAALAAPVLVKGRRSQGDGPAAAADGDEPGGGRLASVSAPVQRLSSLSRADRAVSFNSQRLERCGRRVGAPRGGRAAPAPRAAATLSLSDGTPLTLTHPPCILPRPPPPPRSVPGLAIILTHATSGVPPVLRQLLTNLPALPRVAVLCTLKFVPLPYVTDDERFLVKNSRIPGVYRVVIRYGYMEIVDMGPAFVRQLVGCLVKHAVAAAPAPAAARAASGFGAAGDVAIDVGGGSEGGEGGGGGDEGVDAADGAGAAAGAPQWRSVPMGAGEAEALSVVPAGARAGRAGAGGVGSPGGRGLPLCRLPRGPSKAHQESSLLTGPCRARPPRAPAQATPPSRPRASSASRAS